MTTIQSNVLDKVVLINLDVHCWTGRRKLDKMDIRGEVPPETLASLGTKAIVDPKKVAPFDSAKRRAERLCAAKGIRLMGAYAIPVDMVDKLEDELMDIQDEFYAKKQEFLKAYRSDVMSWIEEQGEWKDIILNAIVPPERIEKQLQFDWQIFHIAPVAGDTRDGGTSSKVESMGSQLVREITEEANRIWVKSFLMKTKVPNRSLEPIKALHQKMDSLAFLDPKADAIAGLMKKAIDSTSNIPVITGEKLTVLFGLLLVLSNSEMLDQFGEDLMNGKNVGVMELVKVGSSEADSDDFTLETQNESSEESVPSQTPEPTKKVDQSILGWF